MSGILDNKSRILDTIVTLEGRRQIASSKMKIEYVSFSDSGTYYKPDIVSGSADATQRIYFEQSHLPQDQITFEADDSGDLSPFKNNANVNVKNGRILQYTFNSLTSSIIEGSNQGIQFVKGEQFASLASDLLASSLDNFQKLRIIGTVDSLFEDDGFEISKKNIEFVINDKGPISDKSNFVADVNHIDSLFQDIRLSKLKNFQYLPPINKLNDVSIDKRDHRLTSEFQLGNYKPWGRTQIGGLSPEQLESELSSIKSMGYSRSMNFEPTSLNNNIIGQFFEVNYDSMKKLDVIDYGAYVYGGKKKQAFFIGKIVFDDNDTHNFVHLFTLIFG